MQKKYIIPVLMAVPTAMPMMAEITVLPTESWKWEADGQNSEDLKLEGNTVICPVGISNVTYSKELAQGDYTLKFNTTGTSNIKVYVAGQLLSQTGDRNYKFSTNGGVVEVKIEADDTSVAFQFTDAEIVLDFDFAAANAALTALLNADPQAAVIDEKDESAKAVELKARYEKIQETITSIQTRIAAVNDSDPEAAYKIYSEEELFNYAKGEDKISAAIEDLKDVIEAYNEEAEPENARFNIEQENKAIAEWLNQKTTNMNGFYDECVTANTAYEAIIAKIIGEDQNPTDFKYANNTEALKHLRDGIDAYAKEVADLLAEAGDKRKITEEEKNTLGEKASNGLYNEYLALKKDIAADTADANAYVLYTDKVAALEQAYSEAITLIDLQKGVGEGNAFIYATLQAEARKAIEALKNNAIDDCRIKSGVIEGADNFWKNGGETSEGETILPDEKILDNAIAAIKQKAQDLADDAKAQNDAYTAATEAIAELKTKLNDALEGKTVPAAIQSKLDELTNAITTKISDLETSVNDAYAIQGLPVADFDTTVAGIKTDIKNLLYQFQDGGIFGETIKLQNALDKAWNGEEKDGKFEGGIVNDNKDKNYEFIVSLFQSTKDNIQNSINTLPIPEDLDAVDVEFTDKCDEILKSINQLTADAKSLHDAVAAYYNALTPAQKAIDDLEKATTNNNALINLDEKFDIKNYKAIVDLAKDLNDIKDAYGNAVKITNPHDCYDAVVAASAMFNGKDFAADAKAAEKTFRQALTDSNMAVLTAVELPTGVDLSAFEALKTTATDAKTAAETTDPFDAAKYQDADKAIQTAYEAAKDIIESDKAYTDGKYAATITDISTLLNEVREINAETSQEPAKTYYATEAIGAETNAAETSLQGRLDALVKAVNEAHYNNAMLADPKVEGYKTNAEMFSAELQAIKDAASTLQAAIPLNESAHNAELLDNKRVLEKINNALATIADYDFHFTKGMAETIEKLRDEDLNKLNREVAEAYATGKAYSSTGGTTPKDNLEKFTEDYKAIEDKVKANMEEFASEYNESVIEHNAATVEECGWDAMVEELHAVYTSSITSYNAYLDLKNENYKEYIKKTVTSHAAIYEYSTLTRELEAEVAAYLAKADQDHNVLQRDDIFINALMPAGDLINQMNELVQRLSEDVNKKALEYYPTIEGAASSAIMDATTIMRNAKISETIIAKTLNKANDLYGVGYTKYIDATAEGKVGLTAPEVPVEETIGYIMDAIADAYDAVAGTIDLQTAAMEDWNNKFPYTIDEIKADMETVNGFKTLTPEEKAPVLDNIYTALSEASAIDTKATSDTELINNLLGYKNELSTLLNNLNKEVEKLALQDKANVDEQKAIDKFNSEMSGLNGMLDEFEAYIKNLACASNTKVLDAKSDIVTAIDAVQTLINNNQGKLAQSGAAIDAAVELAKTDIAEAYNVAAEQEKAVLANLISDVKVAFNNAKASKNCPADIEDINVSLNTLFSLVDELEFDSNDALTFKQTALNYENLLNNWLVKLQAYDPDHGNTLQATLEALDKLVEDQAAAIAEGKAGVSDLVKDQFDSKYDKLTEELNAIQSAIEAAGNNVITQAGNFEAAINAIGDKLTELNAEAKEAGDKAEADKAKQEINDANFADLTELINTLNSDLEDLKAAIENYGYSEESYYQGRIEVITNTIAQLQQEIDDQNEAVGLDNAVATNLQDQGTTIANAINALEVEAATRYTNAAKYAADQAIANALAALEPGNGKFVVPTMAQEALATLHSLKWMYIEYDGRFTNWLEKWSNRTDAVASELNDYADAFKEIAEAAASVKATAEENTFRYGDVNEDNEVDVLDVQQVLTWVMSLQEIEELSPRVAAAADVNKDGQLNIADVTAIINMAMGENESQVRAAMGRHMVESNNTIYPELVSAENGVRRFAISLANSEVFANGQFDLKLAPGMMLESVTIGERVKGHEVLSQDHGDITRVAVVSMENAAIQGTDGAVVYVEVSGEGNIAIENAVFATPKAVGHVISNGETSAIDKVIEGARDLKERIYNAAGQQLDRVQRGINIIRKSDGTVTKELRK